MNLTEEYIERVIPSLKIDAASFGGFLITKSKNGKQGYYFPCPKCASSQEKGRHRRARTACIIPKQKFNEVYDFHCPRCNTHQSFENFLLDYRPSLGKQYILKKETRNDTNKKVFNFTPSFS